MMTQGGGGPSQGAPGETLYPDDSWICYFCEKVNGPGSDECATYDADGRVCPGHRGSSPASLQVFKGRLTLGRSVGGEIL